MTFKNGSWGIFFGLLVLLTSWAKAGPVAYGVPAALEKCRSGYLEFRREATQWLQAAGDRLNEQEQRGSPRVCARQIWLEMRWLVRSTTDVEGFHERVSKFEEAFRSGQEDHVSPSTGLSGSCYSFDFMQVGETLPRLKELAASRTNPSVPISRLAKLNSPASFINHFERILISRPEETCTDHRTELNSWITDLSRIIFRRLPFGEPQHPELEAAMVRYLTDRWQSPETGFWGAWYRLDDGTIIKTDDMSITFHIISYHQGEIERWPLIAETLLKMRDGRWPYGWLASNGEECSHHYYDVVRIFRRAWPKMSDEQRSRVRPELERIKNWTVSDNYDTRSGKFKLSFICDSSYEASKEYGMKLWRELDFFEKTSFWGGDPHPEAQKIRRLLEL